MTSRRGSAEHLPEGLYAVPSPSEPDMITFWFVRGGRLRDWPEGSRWRPVRPPYPEHLTDRQSRRDWNDAWYDEVYFPWKDAVIEAIAADPEEAAAEFRRIEPDATMPVKGPPVPRPKRDRVPVKRMTAEQRRLAEQRLIATALKAAGLSYSEVAGALDLPRTTAIRRVQVGRAVGQPTVGMVIGDALLSVQIGDLAAKTRQAALEAKTPDDVKALRERLARLEELRGRLVARFAKGRGPFDPLSGGDS